MRKIKFFASIYILCAFPLSAEKEVEDVKTKLENCIVEHVEFQDVSVPAVLKSFFFGMKGITLKLNLKEWERNKTLTKTFDNKNLFLCLQEICRDADLEMKIKKDHVLILSSKDSKPPLPEKDTEILEGLLVEDGRFSTLEDFKGVQEFSEITTSGKNSISVNNPFLSLLYSVQVGEFEKDDKSKTEEDDFLFKPFPEYLSSKSMLVFINGLYHLDFDQTGISRYLKQGKNIFHIVLPYKIRKEFDKTPISFDVSYYESFDQKEPYEKETQQTVKIEQNTYSFTLNLKKSGEFHLDKAKTWKKLPSQEIQKIRSIVATYLKLVKEGDSRKIFDFYEKHRKYRINDSFLSSKKAGYKGDYKDWRKIKEDNYKRAYIKKIKSTYFSRPKDLEIKINPLNKKAIIVSSKHNKPIIKLETEKGFFGAEVRFLNFIYIDEHWQIY